MSNILSLLLPDAGTEWSGDADALEKFLLDHKGSYYKTEDENGITDNDYDFLEAALAAVRPDSPAITGIGVVAVTDHNGKVKHDRLMGSLAKTKELEGLGKFTAKFGKITPVVIMAKLDGLAISLHYERGRLVKALTRGDGEYGEDVTANAMRVDSIPKLLANNNPVTCEVRGEAVIRKSDFNRINSERAARGEKTFANPRNMASGAINHDDPNECAKRCVSFVAYNLLEESSFPMTARLETLDGLGFEVVPWTETFLMSKENIMELIEQEYPRGKDFGYDTDGAVVMVDDVDYWEGELGHSNNRPNYAVAWKWQAETKVAKYLGTRWQVGRTGKVTPVISIEPTELSGASVTSATLYNAKFIINFQLTPGSTVLIQRSGEVIPKCLGRVSPAEKTREEMLAELPSTCPDCGSPLHFDGTQLWCHGTACPAQNATRLLYFAQMSGMKGIGDGAVNKLYDAGFLNGVDDFYKLLDSQDNLEAIVGGSGILRNIRDAVKSKVSYTEKEFITCLGMTGVGEGTSERLIAVFSLDEVIALALAGDPNVFTHIKDIGDITAQAICDGFKRHEQEIISIRKYITINPEPKAPTEGPLIDKLFCLTGGMSRKRSDIEKDIVAAGGKISSPKAGSYLVLGDESEPSTKHQKAIKVGSIIISENDLYAMISRG
jgi:DNA ligase (NAD+)